VETVEVDQSGRVESTDVDTVLAFSNGITASILIPAVEKREYLKRMRQRGLRRVRARELLTW
jgi:hypothetical protein